jgi:hypothetical protein
MGQKPAGAPEEFARAVNDEIKAEMARSVAYDSNRKLAAALEVSSDYVNRRIRNATPWDLHDLEVLGKLFGLEPEIFVNRAVAMLTERGRRDELGARRRAGRPHPSSFDYPASQPARDEDRETPTMGDE